MISNEPKKTWSGREGKIYWQVVCWNRDYGEKEEVWNSYITLYFDDLKQDIASALNFPHKENRWSPESPIRYSYDYYSSDLLSNLPFHHGITFGEKVFRQDGTPIGVKIGCDYGHYWDEGRHYDKEWVYNDLQEVFDVVKDWIKECL